MEENTVDELKQPRKHPTEAKAINDALKHFEMIGNNEFALGGI